MEVALHLLLIFVDIELIFCDKTTLDLIGYESYNSVNMS
jgi:hypothetical protein